MRRFAVVRCLEPCKMGNLEPGPLWAWLAMAGEHHGSPEQFSGLPIPDFRTAFRRFAGKALDRTSVASTIRLVGRRTR
jgi:hypothetical protein